FSVVPRQLLGDRAAVAFHDPFQMERGALLQGLPAAENEDLMTPMADLRAESSGDQGVPVEDSADALPILAGERQGEEVARLGSGSGGTRAQTPFHEKTLEGSGVERASEGGGNPILVALVGVDRSQPGLHQPGSHGRRHGRAMLTQTGTHLL